MHISFTSTTTIPPPLPSILSLKHKAGWFPTSAHPSLTWQHWGAQRLQAASAPPPRGWWRAACLLPPSGHELFLGQQSVPRSSNLSPCTLSRRRLLQSRPQAHTEYQHFLCPFLQNFPPPTPSSSSLVENIAGNPGRGWRARLSYKGIFREKSWHMQCLDDRETQMGEDTIFVRFGQRVLQVGNKKTVMMFYSDYQNEKKREKNRCVPSSTPPPITHCSSCPPTSNIKLMWKIIKINPS